MVPGGTGWTTPRVASEGRVGCGEEAEGGCPPSQPQAAQVNAANGAQ